MIVTVYHIDKVYRASGTARQAYLNHISLCPYPTSNTPNTLWNLILINSIFLLYDPKFSRCIQHARWPRSSFTTSWCCQADSASTGWWLKYNTITRLWKGHRESPVNSLVPVIFDLNLRWVISNIILVIDDWGIFYETALRQQPMKDIISYWVLPQVIPTRPLNVKNLIIYIYIYINWWWYTWTNEYYKEWYNSQFINNDFKQIKMIWLSVNLFNNIKKISTNGRKN